VIAGAGAGPRLWGRDRVLGRINELRLRAADGIGGVVLVAGEAGMGKTALCDAVLLDAKRQGWQVAWAAAVQLSVLPGLWPWRQLLGALDGGDVPVPPSDTGDPAAQRVAQFDAVARRLRQAATATPVLAVLDDAHWTDPATVAMLVHFAAAARQSRVCLLVTYRPEDAPASPLGAALAALRRLATEVVLEPLALPDVVAVATDLGAGDLDDVDAAALVERTRGNPLFVTETIRLLDGRSPRTLDELRVPPAITATIVERLARLPAGCRAVIGVASAIGTDFDASTLAVVADQDVPSTLGLLEPAVAAAVVEERGPGRYAFRHPLFRSAVYDLLGAAGRAAAHARIAAVLEATQAAEPAVLAHHLGRSALPGHAAAAARYAVAAGDTAMARLAYETAARHFDDALALAPATIDRIDVLLRRADADAAAGRDDAAWAGYEEAAELPAIGAMALARAALGRSGGAGMEVAPDATSRTLLERALAAVDGSGPALRARLLARLSVVVAATAPPEQRAGLVADAAALAEAAGDPLALADAAVARCHLHAGPDAVDQRLADAATVVRHATACRQTRLELLGRRLAVEALFERGRLGELRAAVDVYAERAALVRDPRYTYLGPLWRASLASADGDEAAYRRERAELDAVVAALPADSDGRLLARVQELFHLLDIERDAAAAARRYAEAVGVGRGGLPPALAVTRALVLAAAGRAEEARALLARWDTEIRAMPRDAEWLPAVVQLADIARHTGEHALARWAHQALLPYRDLWAVEGIGAALRGPVARAVTALDDVLGGAPAPVDVARLAFDAGTWLVEFGGTAHRVKDSKGMRDIARLVARPGVAVAALELVAAHGAVVVEHALGPVIDDAARTAYRRRVAELDAALDAADGAGDTTRSTSLTAERARLVAELAAAVGLGGRARPTGSSVERARTTVTTRVKDALKRLDAAHPEAARHLRRSLRTGTFCSYDPEQATRWEVCPPS
jgi:AAA ATPase domain